MIPVGPVAIRTAPKILIYVLTHRAPLSLFTTSDISIMASQHILTSEAKPSDGIDMLEMAPKGDAAHITEEEDVKAEVRDIQLKSELDSLSIGAAFKTFKWAAIICSVAGFSAATDGKSILRIERYLADFAKGIRTLLHLVSLPIKVSSISLDMSTIRVWWL